MFENMLTAGWLPIQPHYFQPHWVAVGVPVQPVAADQAARIFSGPQFLTALISGLILAFAFQLLLTNLSVFAGIAVLGRSSHHDDHGDHHDHHESGSLGSTMKTIGLATGFWTLFTVSVSLGLACYLAVRLSLLQTDQGLGAIVGLVIWGAYFCLLFWVSSTTVGSLIGRIVNTATSGFQSILGTATAAMGGKAASNQIVATAEAAAAAVRREFVPDIDPVSIRETVEGYIQKLRPAELDLSSIRSGFESLLSDPELRSMVGPEGLNVDRQKFVDLIKSRSDLAPRDVDRIADQLEAVWKQTVGKQQPDQMSQLVDYLRSTQEGQLDSKEVSNKLDQLISEIRQSRQSGSPQPGSPQPGSPPSGSPITSAMSAVSGLGGGSMRETLQSTLLPLVGMLMGRSDLSDLNLEKILGQVKTAQNVVSDQTAKISSQVKGEPIGTVRADVENYLHTAYFWQLNRDTIAREFRDIIYDSAANPKVVRQQLERLSKADFVTILTTRGMFTQVKIQEIADQLESIRLEVITTARAAEERQASLDLRQKIETYLTLTPKSHLNADEIQRAFSALLQDSDADHDTLALRLNVYDRSVLRELLLQRGDMSIEEVEPVLEQLETARNGVLFQSQSLADQAKERADATWTSVQDYLRNTGKDELNPDAIKNELQLLLHDPQAGASALRARASKFDRDTLVQLLSQRQDLSQDQVDSVLNQVEGNWQRVLGAPQELTGAAKEQVDKVTANLSEYLRNTGKDELNPEGIQRDLNLLFNDPKAGAYALRDRLSHVDRDTLVKLLSQRQDLSEEQVNQIIDQVQQNIRGIIGAPRRFAMRTQQRAMNFESTIEDYLRNTHKDELDPESIKRDLQLMVRDPRLGMSNLGERLSKVDRYTLIALLSQRQDISPEEAERIVGQIESVRDKFLLQLQDVQYRIQGAIDSIFARIRHYLNDLDRPELNYDGIKQDLRTAFDDPQAGFDALRTRLGQFDRNTLVALMSSRRDISEADANRIIDQVEGARNSVLQRAERIQMEAQRRLDDLKRQAQKQAEETRKAAQAAAMWIFLTALVSAIVSAVCGSLAVG